MPAKWFECPDNERIEISTCLKPGGCRMKQRCATLPYLRLVGYDREWKGVSPSAAGTGPRLLYLKATKDYAINPAGRAFAALGVSVHAKLSIHEYTANVLSEEPLSDDKAKGIADILEPDEASDDAYILSDYKTWGSYKVAKAIGLVRETETLIGEDGEPLRFKSGKRKGEIKTRQITVFDPTKADLSCEEKQLNRYRIFFNRVGFPISRLDIQAIVRDGNTAAANSRGVDKNLYTIPVSILPDEEILEFYDRLSAEVAEAFKAGSVRRCNKWESWDGRRCRGYCEVSNYCEDMGA